MATYAIKPRSNLASALAQASDRTTLRDAGHPPHKQSLPSSKHRNCLPTPPNSLSPTLPPHKGRSSSIATGTSSLHPIDSDVDLLKPKAVPLHLSLETLSGIDAADAITPAMLAKHHLPEILLQHGPLAIRFVLAHLTQAVPGFARIPPAKARRLCVAALEGRNGGGIDGDVVFEKTGWGTWDARYRDQPSRNEFTRSGSGEDSSSPVLTGRPPNMSIPYGTRTQTGSRPKTRPYLNSPLLSPTEDLESEDEADKMSLDGSLDGTIARNKITFNRPRSDSEATEEEDWQAMRPEGLMVGSYEPSWASRRGSHVSSQGRPNLKHSRSSQLRNSSMPLSTSEAIRSTSYKGGIMPFQRVYSSSISASLRMQGVQRSGELQQEECGSPSEREAIEALLKLGAM